MRNELTKLALTGILILFFVTACADEGQSANSPNESVVIKDQSTDSTDQTNSIMNQPVDFSTAEAMEASLRKIAEQESDKARKTVENAMQYVLVYDLSVGGDKQKLYKKLDGITPKEIIAKMRR